MQFEVASRAPPLGLRIATRALLGQINLAGVVQIGQADGEMYGALRWKE